MTAPTFMIVPSLACQAGCKYCFGPNVGEVMDERTAKEAVSFVKSIAAETGTKKISIIFHGGEPLLAPVSVWRTLLSEIRTELADYKVKLDMQSNLWNLSDEFLQLLCDNYVSIGTSIDGPQKFCDLNRGEGYYEKTYKGVAKANAAGCTVSAIATITKQTLPHTQDIARHFRDKGMPLVLHGALGGMDNMGSHFALTADEYAGMIKNLYPWYVKNRKNMRIDTLDHFVRGIVTGVPCVCTLRDCFGMFLCVSPGGAITSCQRLAGNAEFCLGNIFDKPSLALLNESYAAKMQLKREKQVNALCGNCEFYPICRGGCYHNALTSGDGIIDPWCDAYKEIFSFVQERVLDEMQSPENVEALAARPAEPDEHPLLREGKYISLSGEIHPEQIADNSRRILAIHELSKTNDPCTAAQSLFEQKICGDPEVTEALLKEMQQGLYGSYSSRNNCYVHITFACNLHCKHCYANGGESNTEMEMTHFERLLDEAIDGRFRQVVITGGEPLVHTQRQHLFEACGNRRGKGTNLVLRTNLTGNFSDTDIAALAEVFDQVVVSVDGNEQTHETRRGAGTYGSVVANLERYARISSDISNAAELSLACVMGADEINGEPGWSVKELGNRLDIKRIRFRPLLPIGRASNLDEPVMCEGLMQHVSPNDMLKAEIRPLTTCGIGQNLFVKPDGNAHPCYAWCGEHTYIGNVFTDGLETVMKSESYARLMGCTVDTIQKCRDCQYRYLCGGACRAWGNQETLDLNAAPLQCDHLKIRAQSLVDAARKYLLE